MEDILQSLKLAVRETINYISEGVDFMLNEDPPTNIKRIEGPRNLDKNGNAKAGSLFSIFNPKKVYGEGSYATVHHATMYCKENGKVRKKTKPFIVKCLPLDKKEGPRSRTLQAVEQEYLFSRAAGLGAKPPIIIKNKAYLCLNYFPDEDLLDYINDHFEPVVDECTIIIRNLLLDAKNRVIDKNIIHRDIKPDNIRINKKTLECVICDFGLATWADDPDQAPVGSIGFTAPEVFRREATTPKVDIWSLGVTIAYLCGQPPSIENCKFRPNSLKLAPSMKWVKPLLNNMITNCPDDRSDIDALIAQYETLVHEKEAESIMKCAL